MGPVNFKIAGGKQLEAALKELGPRVARKLAGRALKAGANVIVREAKSLVPVRTGELRKSITSRVARASKDDERTMFIGFAKPTARRAHFTEFGTRHSTPEPFMRPAMDAKAEEATATIASALGQDIEKEAATLAKGS